MVFALPDSPAFMLGAFEVAHATALDAPKVERAFRGDGRGAGYHARCACLFSGIERVFRPGYRANLVQSRLPALDGGVGKLGGGAAAADVGCGHGASTILMARALPRSRFTGFDYHAASVARVRGGRAGGGGGLPGRGVRPRRLLRRAARHGRPRRRGAAHPHGAGAGRDLHGGGPARGRPAGGQREPGGAPVLRRVHHGLHAGGAGLGAGRPGAQAGPARLEAVLREAGFSRVRVAAETPFNMAVEAKP